MTCNLNEGRFSVLLNFGHGFIRSDKYFVSPLVTSCHQTSLHITKRHTMTPFTLSMIPPPNTFLPIPHINWSSSQHLISQLPTFIYYSSPQLASHHSHIRSHSLQHSLFSIFPRPISQSFLSLRPYMGPVSLPTPHSLVFARPIS